MDIRKIKQVVFDYDTLVYRCGFAAQKKYYTVVSPEGASETFDSKRAANAAIDRWQEEHGKELAFWWSEPEIIAEPVENALHSFKIAVQSVLDYFGVNDYEGYLSTGAGFRGLIAKTLPYKGNRDPQNKPVHYDELREYAMGRWKAKECKNVEADDAVAIFANAKRDFRVICTNDKDLDSVPGWHYNWTKPDGGAYWVGSRDAAFNFYRQILTGDMTDNVQGIRGIGPAKANKILEEVTSPKDAERRILDCYEKAFGKDEGLEKFAETANLVYILRKEQEIGKMWQPKNEEIGEMLSKLYQTWNSELQDSLRLST